MLHFSYRMEIRYENPVGRCYFTIKCIPREDARQRLLDLKFSISPETTCCFGADAFGNRQIYGCETIPHDRFVFQAEGDVEILRTDYEEKAAWENVGIFRVSHGKCVPGPGLTSWYRSLGIAAPGEARSSGVCGQDRPLGVAVLGEARSSVVCGQDRPLDIAALGEARSSVVCGQDRPLGIAASGEARGFEGQDRPLGFADSAPGEDRGGSGGDDYGICMALMHRLHREFPYIPGKTSVSTTAEEAWSLGGGVCQDYAHIYVTLLRMAGIPARYVCGLIIGEGASHAWAEALCGGRWVPFDPTHDRPVTEGYIKLGHGRDAADCAINRGLMWNGGAQSQIISASVEQ